MHHCSACTASPAALPLTASLPCQPPAACLHTHRRPAQVLAEALGWMAEAVPDFGLAAMDVGAIIEWCKADLGSPNAPGAL